jgi:hypothetical protein
MLVFMQRSPLTSSLICSAREHYSKRVAIHDKDPEVPRLHNRVVLAATTRDSATSAGTRLLRQMPRTRAGLATGPTTVYKPGGGGWKRWSTGRCPRVSYSGRQRFTVMARLLRWTYTLTGR